MPHAVAADSGGLAQGDELVGGKGLGTLTHGERIIPGAQAGGTAVVRREGPPDSELGGPSCSAR